MNTQDIEIIKKAAMDIYTVASYTTSGNVSHNVANIKAGCMFIADMCKDLINNE